MRPWLVYVYFGPLIEVYSLCNYNKIMHGGGHVIEPGRGWSTGHHSYEYLSQLSEKRGSLFTEFIKSNAALFSVESRLRYII